MAGTKKIVYTGDQFRHYLMRNNKTYQEASVELKLDKNTIGKVVRGGNMNVNVLLTICNEYGLDFGGFVKSDPDAIENQNSRILKPESFSDLDETVPFAAEEFAEYAVTPKEDSKLEELLRSKDEEIRLLKEINALYKDRIDLLEEKLRSR